MSRHSFDFTYLIAYGLQSEWTEWACLDSSDTEYNNERKRTQRVRYKVCTNPSEYDGGAYCGTNTEIRQIQTPEEDPSNDPNISPLCYNGVWFCSKVGVNDKEGTLGDGSTQGSCGSEKTCFTYPEYSNGCLDKGNSYSFIANMII